MDGAAGTVFNHCWHRFQNVLLLLPCSSRDAAPGSSRNPCPGIVQDTAVQGLCSLIPAEIPVQDTAVQGFCSLIPAEILVQGFCSLIPAEFPAQDTADHLTAPSPHKILYSSALGKSQTQWNKTAPRNSRERAQRFLMSTDLINTNSGTFEPFSA